MINSLTNTTNQSNYGRPAALVELATGVHTDLRQNEIRIGRSRDNDLVLDGDLSASRRQARITRIGDCYFLEDLASTNGTLLNGKQIHGRALLNHDDVINLGRRIFLFSTEDFADEDDQTVQLTGNGMVTVMQSAHRMVADVLNKLGGVAANAQPNYHCDSLGTTIPHGANNRFAQGKLFSTALRQYQKRKQIPMNFSAQAQMPR